MWMNIETTTAQACLWYVRPSQLGAGIHGADEGQSAGNSSPHLHAHHIFMYVL